VGVSRASEGDVFLDAAFRIGAKLARDAVWFEDRCNWLSDSLEPIGGTWSVVHRALGPDFYAGTSGIALFLATLFDMTGEKHFRNAAKGAIRQATSRLGDVSIFARPGLYSGLTGIVHALDRVGELIGEDAYADEAVEIASRLDSDDLNAQGLDLMTGSAGAILGLLSIYERRREDALLALAIRHGERLLAVARKGARGWSWDTLPGQTRQDLTGLSHGAAGIGCALLELHRVTGDATFREAALEAFNYERQCFSREHRNWPDFRSFGPPGQAPSAPLTYSVAWCHGATGIGFARLRAFQVLGSETLRDEAATAVRTTTEMLVQSKRAPLGDASLCHGLCGNAELLSYASTVFAEPRNPLVEELALLTIERYLNADAPYPCGVPGGGETPSLMLGLAGIGYFYLRLHDARRVPSVLIVAPEQDAPGRPVRGR
jgi:type 2 lantibiotic biosynthesis protein LanM